MLSPLFRIGWTITRESGSHRTLERAGWPDVVFAFHDHDEIGPRMLARLAKRTGLTPAVASEADRRAAMTDGLECLGPGGRSRLPDRRNAMRRVAMLIGAAAVVCLAAGVVAQTMPDFAGTWTLVPDPNAPDGPGFGGLGTAATIVQDAKTLTVTRTTQFGEIKSVYNLDGSDSKNSITGPDGSSFDLVSKAVWNAGHLDVTTTGDFGGNSFQTKMSLSLGSDGTLVVDTERPDFQGGGAPVKAKMTYKKS
ncbi:MAG TPA: type II toxin-antitoxin system HicA family toxin [Vicinamibacterales bacterium]|nr:type II toxin-antitoxin system HicA family toxin [Vicinamibacterales bacterium]